MHLEPYSPIYSEMETSNKVCTENGEIGKNDIEINATGCEKTASVPHELSSTAFVIDFSDAYKSENKSLQEAFLKYRETKKDQLIVENKKRKKKKKHDPSCPKRMAKLRKKFLNQAMKYIGTPYARKYWSKDSPEYSSPFFLDCCGLVRRVLLDLKKDFGFKIGRWNQAYMYDTLPITIEREEDMKPGDLVFMSGIYTNPKSKKQIHNMTHVEIWYGDGPKVLASRWNNGKVSIFDHYKFEAKSFHSSVYHFKSIDTWLKGICKSFCPEHPWRKSRFGSKPSKKSVFSIDNQLQNVTKQASSAANEECDKTSVASSSENSLTYSSSETEKMVDAQSQESGQVEGLKDGTNNDVVSASSQNSPFISEITSAAATENPIDDLLRSPHSTICDFYRDDAELLLDSCSDSDHSSRNSVRPKSKNMKIFDGGKQDSGSSEVNADSLPLGDLDLHCCDKCSENPVPEATNNDLNVDFSRINDIISDIDTASCEASHLNNRFDSFDETDSDVSYSDEEYDIPFEMSSVSDANEKHTTNQSQEPSSGDISGGSAENSENENPSDGGKGAKKSGSGNGSAGGSGGGGGKKQPTKPTKLPNCSLPANMTPTFYIGGGNGVALVEDALQALGWKRITDKYDERYKLKWVECKGSINWSAFRESEQLVNHIPNCQLLTNKLGLLNSLQEYERVTLHTKGRFPRLKFTEFVPETFKLDEKTDREAFLDTYKDGEMWICKPTGMNRGKGIYIIRSRDQIVKILEERDIKAQKCKPNRPLMSRVIQRYIPNPLLLNGRKFDIRAYMLIANSVPYLVLYHKGYIRTSCLKYDGEDTNLTTHLTNQVIQRKDENYEEMKEDTVWSMKKFNEYINEHVMEEKGLEENWVFNTLTKQMQKIMLHCFNSVKRKLQTKVGHFSVYGFDFMIDEDMKTWLIEINVNPAIHTQCETLKELIPDMVKEALYISIECFEKTRRNQLLMPLNSMKNFVILYCGKRQGAVAPRQIRSVSPVKETTDQSKSPQARRSVSPSRPVPKPVVKQLQTSVPQSSKTGQTSATSTSISVTPKESDISLPPLSSSSNDEVKLKMTHCSASSKRGKQERGN